MSGGVDITVESNAEQVGFWFNHVRRHQVPFATSKAVNATVLDGRNAARLRMTSAFKVRSRGLPRAAVGPNRKADPAFSHKGQWPRIRGVVYVGPDFPFFELQETGGTKRGQGGHRISVPTRIVKTRKRGGPISSQRPRSIRRRKGAHVDEETGGAPQIVHKPRGRRLGIFYTLHDSVKLRPRFRFEITVVKVVRRVYGRHFLREYTDSIKPRERRARLK